MQAITPNPRYYHKSWHCIIFLKSACAINGYVSSMCTMAISEPFYGAPTAIFADQEHDLDQITRMHAVTPDPRYYHKSWHCIIFLKSGWAINGCVSSMCTMAIWEPFYGAPTAIFADQEHDLDQIPSMQAVTPNPRYYHKSWHCMIFLKSARAINGYVSSMYTMAI